MPSNLIYVLKSKNYCVCLNLKKVIFNGVKLFLPHKEIEFLVLATLLLI